MVVAIRMVTVRIVVVVIIVIVIVVTIISGFATMSFWSRAPRAVVLGVLCRAQCLELSGGGLWSTIDRLQGARTRAVEWRVSW